jgi:signal peptidase II
MKWRAILPYTLVALAAVALDQWVKALVEANMALREQIDLLPFLALFHTHNSGIAFSLFAGLGDKGLIAVALAVILFVLWLAARSTPGQVLARTGFALVIGGAIGNLIDRVRLGYVIDYVLFHTPVWSFAIFNLADACITLGAVLILLDEFVAWRRESASPEASKPPAKR